MFVYNLKVDKKKIKKYGLIALIMLLATIIIMFFFTKLNNNYIFKVNDEILEKDVNELNTQNYTNILKSVHDNPDNYLGQKIKFSGYIYKVYDFNSNQFVLARNMVISSDFQTVVVGFLCESHETCNYENDTWVEIIGEITKGEYHGDIPVIKISNIKKIDKPSDEYVYPPDNNYLPTVAIY